MAVKLKNEPQVTDRLTDFNDLNEEDWPSQVSFIVDSDFSDTTIGSSRATESERETIISSSSSTSSRSSSIHRATFEANEAKVAEMDNALARVIEQVQAMSAATPSQPQKPVVLESAKSKLPHITRIEPMTAPTKVMMVRHNILEQHGYG